MYSYTIYIKESWFVLMVNIKIVESRLHFSVFNLIFLFSIFRTTRVRVRNDQSHSHISYNLMVWSQH